MRACGLHLVIATFFPLIVGCSALTGYVVKGNHFALGTAREAQIDRSVDQTVSNLRTVLGNQGIGIRKVEANQETARVTANRDGLEYVFDIKSVGPSSCSVHMEISQAGNEQIAFSLLQELGAMP